MGVHIIDCSKDCSLLRGRMAELIAPKLSGNSSSRKKPWIWGWLKRKSLLINTSDAWIRNFSDQKPRKVIMVVT